MDPHGSYITLHSKACQALKLSMALLYIVIKCLDVKLSVTHASVKQLELYHPYFITSCHYKTKQDKLRFKTMEKTHTTTYKLSRLTHPLFNKEDDIT